MGRSIVRGIAAVCVCSGLTALLLASCSAPAQDSADTLPSMTSLGPMVTVPVSAPSAPVPDDAALRSTLLTPAQLPTGFRFVADPVDDLGLPAAPESSASDKSSTDPAVCKSVLARIADQHAGAASAAAAYFEGPNFSSIDQDSAGYPDSAEAARAFATVQETLHRCTQYAGTDADGVQVKYRIGALDQASAGDASTAFRLVTSSQGFVLISDVVVVVSGSTLTQVVATGPKPIAAAVLDGLTAAAVARIVEHRSPN